MYTAYFGFTLPPFRITPDPRCFFGGSDRGAILLALRHAITAGEGILKVTGEVGTGKTMLCRMLQETLPDSVVTICLTNPQLGPHDITGALLAELGLALEPNAGRLQLQRALREYLVEQHRGGKRVLVLVEEAQCMPDTALEALRLLSNLETDQDKLLQVVLFGQPELDELLTRPQMRPLRDRIVHAFRLETLSHRDVVDYLRFRLHSAGYTSGDLFSEAACRQLARASHGLIRRIHLLADKALLAAYSDQSHRVEKRHVDRAVRDDSIQPAAGKHWLGSAAALAAGLAALSLAAIHLPDIASRLQSERVALATSTSEIAALAAIRPAAGGSLANRRLSATSAWLAGEQQGHLTIQVLLTEDDDLRKLESVLRRDDLQPLLDNIYVKESHVAGRRRFSVLYGEFSDKSEAYRALAALPDFLQLHKPFLRSLSAIRGSDGTAPNQG